MKTANKKGIYRLLTFPVFILIVFIMALFVLISSAASILNGPGKISPDTLQNFRAENILLIPIETQTNNEIFLVEAIIEELNGNQQTNLIRDTLASIVDENNKFAALAVYPNTYYFAVYRDGKTSSQKYDTFDQMFSAMETFGCPLALNTDARAIKASFTKDNQNIDVFAYYGDCK